MKPRKTSSPLERLFNSLVSTPIPFGNMLINSKFSAIKHHPDKESIIDHVWKNSVILYWLLLRSPKMRNLIMSTHVFHRKNNWMTFLDKLSSCNKQDLNTLPIYLLRTLLQESISKEKDFKPFWTPAYKELSEKLLLPTEIDFAGLDSNSSNTLSRKTEEKLPSLTMTPIKVQNKNLQRTCFPLSTSTVADKWVNEVTPVGQLKVLQIKVKPSLNQKKILNEWINTSNYVYNKAVEEVYQKKHPADFQPLRDKLVTANTKKNNKEYTEFSDKIGELRKEKNALMKIRADYYKNQPTMSLRKLKQLSKDIEEKETEIKSAKQNLRDVTKELPSEKNNGVYEWELRTPKEVRAGAVNDVCKAIKTGIANIKAGNIRHFRLGYRKYNENYKSVVIPKNFLKNKDGVIQLAPEFFKEDCKFEMGKKTLKKHKNLAINNDCRIVKRFHEYWLLVPVPMVCADKKPPVNYSGVDPGVRTFMTSFGNNGCLEYDFNDSEIKKIDAKIRKYTDERTKKPTRVYKAKLVKMEQRKKHLVDELHWKTINHLLKRNDFLFYGNIKSHDIVKDGKNRTLNKGMHNLKFYTFKQRLLFKATERGKQVYVVNEAYTTQTCSFCGNTYKGETSKVYHCSQCKRKIGRDVNAAKNILMKGILRNLF